jgi:ferritin
MLNSKIEEAFNKQLNAELYASYLYLSMSADFETKNLRGMAHWMRLQSQEEYSHAMKFYGQIIERGGRVKLATIEAPKTDWAAASAAFQDAYQHECKVTGMINDMMNLAIAEKDHAAVAYLQWFVKEQVEEEAGVLAIVEQMKMIGDMPGPLFMLDHHLGQRGK